MSETENVQADQTLDLRGEVCPYTFVKAKLALEMMASGEVLQVTVDHLPAVENVPRSLEREGQEIVDVSQVNDCDWHIVVRKA